MSTKNKDGRDKGEVSGRCCQDTEERGKAKRFIKTGFENAVWPFKIGLHLSVETFGFTYCTLAGVVGVFWFFEEVGGGRKKKMGGVWERQL